MTMELIRTVSKRDSATAILRKLGVNPRDYDLFIERTDDGLKVKIGLADDHVQSLKAAAANKPKPPKAAKPPKVSVSTVCRELILAGRSNEETWAAVKEQFRLDDSKRHYPAWYRGELRRQGKLPKE